GRAALRKEPLCMDAQKTENDEQGSGWANLPEPVELMVGQQKQSHSRDAQDQDRDEDYVLEQPGRQGIKDAAEQSGEPEMAARLQGDQALGVIEPEVKGHDQA